MELHEKRADREGREIHSTRIPRTIVGPGDGEWGSMSQRMWS